MGSHEGEQFGNYRLIRLLGKGGFAEVYLGEHIHLNTKVAIKVLHTQLTDDDVERFRTEARIIADLKHPNIVRVLDFGIENSIPFLVMEFAPNGTLRQRHRHGSRVPLDLIISYVKQIAAALQHAHAQKLVHRDVKPDNMLIGLNDEILLTDFGLAIISQSTSYQSMQHKGGTLAYMAPEQFEGKPRPASDQYALGVTVYEWLCGEHPFHGIHGEIEAQHCWAAPPSLHKKVPSISPTVEQVVLKALAKEPKDRFPSVQAFALALEQAIREVAIEAKPSSAQHLLPLLTPSEGRSGVASLLKADVSSPSSSIEESVDHSLESTSRKSARRPSDRLDSSTAPLAPLPPTQQRLWRRVIFSVTMVLVLIVASLLIIYASSSIHLLPMHLTTGTTQATYVATHATKPTTTAALKLEHPSPTAKPKPSSPPSHVPTTSTPTSMPLQTTLIAGQKLTANQAIFSSNGQYKLIMQAAGNLVLYASNAWSMWSPPSNQQGDYAEMQSDGNFVIYNQNAVPQWATHTTGLGIKAVVLDNGDFVIYGPNNMIVWSSWSTLTDKQILYPSQLMLSDNTQFHLYMQANGDLELMGLNGAVLWSSQTSQPESYAEMLSNGNLVIYSPNGVEIWQSYTANNLARAVLQKDGHLVICGLNNATLFSGPSGGHC